MNCFLRSTLIAIILLLLIRPNNLFAQGIHLKKGSNGFIISGSYSSSDDATGIGADAGLSLNGLFDLGISVARSRPKDEDLGDIKATSISPFVEINIFKQTDTIPISLSIGGSFSKVSFSGGFLDDYNWEAKGIGFSYGGLIYGSMMLSQNANLVPMVAIVYNYNETRIEDSYGESVTDDSESLTFKTGFSIDFITPTGNVFFILPSISIDDDDYTSLDITIGLIVVMPSSR